ncbi:MAG TPA: hypothetical protein VND62_11295 [Acidimicrobiales bacterium]|nr:hypothetical protein [Acidimicrobiales bacterium]
MTAAKGLLGLVAREVRPGDRVLIGSGLASVRRVLASSGDGVAIFLDDGREHLVPSDHHVVVEREWEVVA